MGVCGIRLRWAAALSARIPPSTVCYENRWSSHPRPRERCCCVRPLQEDEAMAESDARYAVVIESHHPLAEGVADCLRQRGYTVGIAGTHASGAAWAASRDHVHFLVAAVPAVGES